MWRLILWVFGKRDALEAGLQAVQAQADAAETNGMFAGMDPAKTIRARLRAYKNVFSKDSQDAQIVLADLCRFARVGRSVFGKDERETNVRIGRSETVQRILDAIAFTEEYQVLNQKTKENP
jgi:hypothetical protein